MTFAEKQIKDSLEESAKNITEIAKDAGLAKGTVSDIVNRYEEENKVNRFYDSEKKKVLVELSGELADSVNKTIRHLNNISPSTSLNKEKGGEILKKQVITAIEEISILYSYPENYTRVEDTRRELERIWIPPITEEPRELKEIPDITEHKLLKALSRYFLESRMSKFFPRVKNLHTVLGRHFEKVETDVINFDTYRRKFPEKKRENPLLFPVLKICRDRNVEKDMENLLSWLEPLLRFETILEPVPLHRNVEEYPEERIWAKKFRKTVAEEIPRSSQKDEDRDLDYTSLEGDNLAIAVFIEEARRYADWELAPAWSTYFSVKEEKECA